MNRLAVNLSMALLIALGLLACDNDEKPTGPNQPAPAGSATVHPPALVSPHSGPSQLPEPGDIALPDLLPGPSGSALPRPALDLTDLEQATVVVWGSILGTEPSDPVVARLLADVPVLMSGIRQIKGRTYLYLGIGRAYFNRHGGEHIYNTLTKRFPTVPLYIEPSDGVQPLSASRAAQEEASPTDTLLADPFQAGLGAWTTTNTGTGIGWRAQAFDETPLPGAEAGNLVAIAQTADCPENCDLTLTTPLDLSRYSSVTLSFDRWVDDALEAGEFLAVELGNHGAYTRLATWTDADGDSTWHRETYALDAADLSSAVTVRFIAQPDNPLTNLFDSFFGSAGSPTPKTLAIDNVLIVPAPGAVILEGNLTVESVSASPTAVASGDQVLLQVSIVNDGDATASSQSVRVYRHTARTTNPTAGTRVGGATTGSLAAGASVTKSIAVTAPTVSVETTYHYYVCLPTACAHAQVTVNPEEAGSEEEETGTPNLTIQTSATPTPTTSGDQIAIRTTVRNTGNASTPATTITVYRHTGTTTNPTTGGTRIGFATTNTIRPNASATRTITTTAPTVTAQTTYHYYACIGTTCTRAQVIVNPKPDEPLVTPEHEVMGGDRITAYYKFSTRGLPTGTSINPASAGTLTLGGLTTTDGTQGFVISGHAAFSPGGDTVEDFLSGATDALIFGGYDKRTRSYLFKMFLGKVTQIPRPHTGGKYEYDDFFYADAAFVAYPSTSTSDCSLVWTTGSYTDTNRTFCLDLGKGDQVETVTPLAIRGKHNMVYDVVGSQAPTMGLPVMFSGSASGDGGEGNRVTSGVMLSGYESGGGSFYIYSIDGGQESQGGDSGSPIYTVPDRNGSVRMVGILVGGVVIAGEKITTFSAWNDVMKELDLQPIR